MGPERGEGAADGSLSQHSPLHLRLLPQKTSQVEVEWAEKRTELSLGKQKETKEDAEEGQKVPGSWKTVRRERHDWKGPKDFKCGRRFSLQI